MPSNSLLVVNMIDWFHIGVTGVTQDKAVVAHEHSAN